MVMSRRSPLATVTVVEVVDAFVKPPGHLFNSQKYHVPTSVEILPPLPTTATLGGGGVMEPRYLVLGIKKRGHRVLLYFMRISNEIGDRTFRVGLDAL
jgi:hypothetical protein